jgi:cholesterol oxidase
VSLMYEAVVIGSGFGGSVSACRLSKRWPGGVLLLERGKRYALGTYARTPHAFAHNLWSTKFDPRARTRPSGVSKIEARGLFDVRNYKHLDVVIGAGLGGGSLIYANVFMEPPEEVFAQGWPENLKRRDLLPYYAVAKEVLGSRRIPEFSDPRRRVLRTELYQRLARKLGRDSRTVDINVFFGSDPNHPLEPGMQQTNRYGALQTSCVYCGECDIGCNYQAKNTLDLNYLHQAQSKYGAQIRTEHLVDRIVPISEEEADDSAATGRNGYRIYYRDLANEGREETVTARRVIVCAGTLGSTEILLRCRDVFKSLSGISPQLGKGFSGNGDFLSFVVGTHSAADPNYGPVITQRIDFNLFEDFDRERAFILEDASYPAFLAWFVEGAKPGVLWLRSLWLTLRHVLARIKGHTTGPIGFALQDLLSGDLSYHTMVMLCMGLDRANGVMTLGRDGWLDINWPSRKNRQLYEAILRAGRELESASDGDVVFALPTWWWPFRKNVTVHPLGGCALSTDASAGVTSSLSESFGQIHGYTNLFVADGSIVPTAVGANPTATITALAERIAAGITGIEPTADL